MKVDAWMCDRCGRMRPAEDPKVPPAGWLDVGVTKTGESSARLLFCSGQCASIWFRPKPKRRPKPAPELDAGHVCPECDRTFTRAQALGAHRSRVHKVAGKSRKRAA